MGVLSPWLPASRHALFRLLCPTRPLSVCLQLEMVGNAGIVVLLAVAIIVMVKSISNGLPALASRDFAHVSTNDLSERGQAGS